MVRKIIVLGGGSAGFMAAIALRAKVPGVDVLVVRSKDIGIIGVGEGSTLALTRFLHEYLKVGLRRFHETAQPTWKLGLRFLWGSRPSFHYTFGPGLEARYPDLRRATGYYCDADAEHTDLISALMAEDRAFERTPGGGIKFHDAVSYHFENERFVRFLEGYAAAAAGVRTLDATVVDVRRGEAGIAGLTLDTGATESADLYVDCSGFASVLLGKALGERFVPFASSLFCDRAVVGGWPRPPGEVVKPYTTCETMDAGWCWQIEHEARVNRGYVYASAFASDDDARAEFTAKNPRVEATRVVRFTSGRYERGWVKNVVAIGNASGFVEPLEATALGVIAMQARLVADTLAEPGGRYRPTQVAEYNDHHARTWDAIRDFIAVHYKFNDRLDTPFWRACRADTTLGRAERVVAHYRENGPSALWQPTLFDDLDPFKMAGYAAMLVGMRVPYDRDAAPPEAEVKAFEAKRRAFREAARKAMTVDEALATIRSRNWQWA